MKRTYSDAKQVATLRYLGKPSICRADWDAQKRDISKDAVYNHLPSFLVDTLARPTNETRRQADGLFGRIATSLGPRKYSEKRAYFQCLFHASKRAMHEAGCIRFSRDTGPGRRIHLKVINSAVKAGLFLEHRSPPGSPKMSRLLPLHPIEKHATRDPWEFDPNEMKQFVYLRKRRSGDEMPVPELPIDWTLPIASETQARLELINAVNSKWDITYEPWDIWNADYQRTKQIRPVHYAIFIERWDWYGRLHTGKYGHQSLRRQERKTICFDGEGSVERDYVGMHPRLLYHLENLPFERDPYALWGEKTTPPMRLMAKQLINAALNASTPQKATSACNHAMNTKTKAGQRKSGKELLDAQQIYNASLKTGLRFNEIYPLAVKHHRRIAQYFGTDFGIVLMRMDSSIAIDVLYHFAKRGCPCLSVHDSFIVPVTQDQELKRVMHEFYYQRSGFLPVVK